MKNHLEILENIKNNAGKSGGETAWVKKYMGTDKIFYCLKSATIKTIAEDFIKNHPDISLSEYIVLLDSLFSGKFHEEIRVASLLLQFLPKLRKQLEPKNLNKWLNNVCGWAEIDSICQSNFSAEELLDNWKEWKNLILKLSKNKNISKKLASLVLLTKPTRTSENAKLADLAFHNIDKLKFEKDILVIKAISWLLRCLINHHSDRVKLYLEKNKDTLPKIAIRETKNKLITGKK